jgi:hypothetical protein
MDLNMVEPNISMMHPLFRIVYREMFFTISSEATSKAEELLDYSIHKAKERNRKLELNGTQHSPKFDIKFPVQKTEYHE